MPATNSKFQGLWRKQFDDGNVIYSGVDKENNIRYTVRKNPYKEEGKNHPELKLQIEPLKPLPPPPPKDDDSTSDDFDDDIPF